MMCVCVCVFFAMVALGGKQQQTLLMAFSKSAADNKKKSPAPPVESESNDEVLSNGTNGGERKNMSIGVSKGLWPPSNFLSIEWITNNGHPALRRSKIKISWNPLSLGLGDNYDSFHAQ